MKAMFKPLEVVRENLRVDIEYIGEGWSGDYDPDDEEDEQLLRFSCLRRQNDEWEEFDDASYCTRLSVNTDRGGLEKFANAVLDELQRAVDGGGQPKRTLEVMSWVTAKELV